MKLKYLILALAAVAFISSCDDTLDQIGSSIQPDSDKLTVSTDTFDVASSTVIVDSIYAKTTIGLLGSYNSNNEYGKLDCDYLGQLYCPENFRFNKYLYGDKLDSVTVFLTYQSYVGDSLAPMQVSLYKINDANVFNNGGNAYSNSNEPSHDALPLAKKSYTAYNTSLGDSLRNLYGTTKFVEIKLPQTLANEFYDKVKNNRDIFANNESFQKYFPGLYLKTTYSSGTGSIIKVLSTELRFHYLYEPHYTDSIGEPQYTYSYMAFNKEVYQVNRYQNSKEDLQNLINDQTATYIKSPAGVFTKLTFPIGKMAKVINKQDQRLNGVKLELGSFRVVKSKEILQPPTYLLMVKASEMKDLFSHKIAFDPNKHLYATYKSSDNSYTFSNIKTFFEDDLSSNLSETATEDVYLVPITIANTSSSGVVTKISHYFEPSAVKLNSKGLKISIIYSK